MSTDIRILKSGDEAVLNDVAADVFDNALEPALLAEFLRDERHHLAVALEGGQVVGFASGVHYVHPDKPPELWINEVGVAPSHHRRGIGKAIMAALLQHAKSLGCKEAWVLTERSNHAAMRLYASTGGEQAQSDQVMFTFFLEPDDEDDDPAEEERWCAERRAQVARYLQAEGVDHGQIGEWPAWHIAPYVSVWAIESKKAPGSLGWWVICGDLPTDYVSAHGMRHPREAVRAIAQRWREMVPYLERGESMPGMNLGTSATRKELAPLLRVRSEMLQDWVNLDEVWPD